MRKMIFGVLLSGAVGMVFAQTSSQSSNSTIAQPNATPMATCPLISEIKKDPIKGNWTATTKYGFWKSYHQSFATNLVHFIGAQWVGANVGQVTCLYSSNQQFMMNGQLNVQKTIPILLVYHALAHQPTGAGWKHVSHGVYNCTLQNQNDCAFAMNIAAPSVGNIFEEAESLKSKQPKNLSPLNTN